MAGGTLTVEGDVGDFAASTLPGSMDGMRGGSSSCAAMPARASGDRMRRGTVLVYGDAGDFVASRLVAGTIALAGAPARTRATACGAAAWCLPAARPSRRPPSCRRSPTCRCSGNCWRATWRAIGGPFDNLHTRRIERHLGDLGADGKGEWIVAR